MIQFASTICQRIISYVKANQYVYIDKQLTANNARA